MTDKKRRQDPIDNALRKVRKASWAIDCTREYDDNHLAEIRAACTALLKLTPEQRQKVLAAAEALG